MSLECVQAISAAFSAAAAVAVAFFTWRLVVLNRTLTELQDRNVWLTGALESHSATMLRIEAARGIRPGQPDPQPIRVVWWDPEYAQGWPLTRRRHGEQAQLDTIYVGVHPNVRAQRDRENAGSPRAT